MPSAVAPTLPLAFHTATVPTAGATVVEVSGEIDLFVEDTLEHALSAAMEGSAAVLVDLSGCSLFGSTGLNAMARAQRESQMQAFAFAVIAPPGGQCRFVLELGLSEPLQVFDDRSSGLEALRPRA